MNVKQISDPCHYNYIYYTLNHRGPNLSSLSNFSRKLEKVFHTRIRIYILVFKKIIYISQRWYYVNL